MNRLRWYRRKSQMEGGEEVVFAHRCSWAPAIGGSPWSVAQYRSLAVESSLLRTSRQRSLVVDRGRTGSARSRALKRARSKSADRLAPSRCCASRLPPRRVQRWALARWSCPRRTWSTTLQYGSIERRAGPKASVRAPTIEGQRAGRRRWSGWPPAVRAFATPGRRDRCAAQHLQILGRQP